MAAPNGAQRKINHFAHPGPTAKRFLETNDAGHEQKGATTKKKDTLAPLKDPFTGTPYDAGSQALIAQKPRQAEDLTNRRLVRRNSTRRHGQDTKGSLLGGSGVVISRVINPLIWVVSIVTLLVTLLITTHEPPSTGFIQRLRLI